MSAPAGAVREVIGTAADHRTIHSGHSCTATGRRTQAGRTIMLGRLDHSATPQWLYHAELRVRPGRRTVVRKGRGEIMSSVSR
jgi:hypothetical protein